MICYRLIKEKLYFKYEIYNNKEYNLQYIDFFVNHQKLKRLKLNPI